MNKDFRGGERRLYRHHGVSQQDENSADVSSDVSVSLHELSIEVKYLYIASKGFFMIRQLPN